MIGASRLPRRGRGGGDNGQCRTSPLQREPSLVPMEAGASTWAERLQWWLHPLHVTEQWHFASMAVWASSMSIPSCRAPHSCPLRLSPHSKQQSLPCICSPNPMFQHPTPVHNGGHLSQAGACRAVAQTICVGLTLSCLPQAGCCALLRAPKAPLLSQLISPPVRGLPWMQESLLSFRSPPGVQVLTRFLSSFFSLFLSSYPVMQGSFLSF